VAQDRQNQEAAAEAVATMDPWEVQEYLAALDLEAAKSAATERLGRGAKGMSERSRREMWRWVLSLPFDMLGDRPLWITLTYPGDWRRWVPDGPTLERHRRAFGEAWYRGFGERPVGLWSKRTCRSCRPTRRARRTARCRSRTRPRPDGRRRAGHDVLRPGRPEGADEAA
jgi:hypothetical protein